MSLTLAVISPDGSISSWVANSLNLCCFETDPTDDGADGAVDDYLLNCGSLTVARAVAMIDL